MTQKKTFRSASAFVAFILGSTFLVTSCQRNSDVPPTQSGQVVGGSMFPSLVGLHYTADCEACKREFYCDVEHAAEREFLVCPNCGFDAVKHEDMVLSKAENVDISLLDEKDVTSLKRWDIVAFKVPGSSGQLGVKRVVGLPGENIAIRKGNLFLDGNVIRKPLEVQRQMRVAVFDSRFRKECARRWRSDSNSAWTMGRVGFRWNGSLDADPGPDWLVYHHQRCYDVGESNDRPIKIEDSYGFNQSVARDLNETDEIFLEVSVTQVVGSVVALRYFRGELEHTVEVDSLQKSVRLRGVGAHQSVAIPDRLLSKKQWLIEFSTFDQQLIVALNGQLCFVKKLPFTMQTEVNQRPIMVSGTDGKFTVDRIRLWRDVYYLGPSGLPKSSFDFQADEREFVVLGDNVPISIDSRHWEKSVLLPANIIGKVNVRKKPE